MEPRIVRGRPVGSDHVSRPRRRRERSAVCASPGCEEQAGEGRFCPAHQEILDRVHTELEDESGSGEAQTHMLRRSTRGLRHVEFDEPSEQEGPSEAAGTV